MSDTDSITTQEQLEEMNWAIQENRRQSALRDQEIRQRFDPLTVWERKNKQVKAAIRLAYSEEEAIIQNVFGHSIRNQTNYIMTGRPQMGKTGMFNNVLLETGDRSISVVSCDNRDDQVLQLSKRMHLAGIENLKIKEVKVTKAGNIKKEFLKKILHHYDIHKKLTFVLLNNTIQVSKLSVIINQLLRILHVERYQVFHDEADLINKSDKVDSNGPENISKVHKDWIEHFNNIKVFHQLRFVKRMWVSATPENCSLIKDVKAKDVFVLPKHPDYRCQNIFEEWPKENGDALEPLVKEAQRIKRNKSKEVILYCTERLNAAQETISVELCRKVNCPVVSYNGIGNTIFKPGQNPRLNNCDTISDILAELEQDLYTGPVIVVGHALMSRGISFVSSKRGDKPLSATVMFYKGSTTTHAVNIAQRTGRIAGTSRDDVDDRKIYCSKSINECDTNYFANQTAIYRALKKPENKERFVADIMADDEIRGLKKLGRKVDRNELGKANSIYASSCSRSESSSGTSEHTLTDEDWMKKLIIYWFRPNNNDRIKRVFMKMYSNEGYKMLTSEIKTIITTSGPLRSMTNRHISNWDKVFTKDELYHYIKPEAVAFANTL